MSVRRVRIKDGWEGAGRIGTAIGSERNVNGVQWMPVIWDGEEAPSWSKAGSLEAHADPPGILIVDSGDLVEESGAALTSGQLRLVAEFWNTQYPTTDAPDGGSRE